MTPSALFWYAVLLLWVAYLPYGSKWLLAWWRTRSIFVYKPTGREPSAKIVFLVAARSVSDIAATVKETVDRAREAAALAGLTESKVVVVSDDPADRSNPAGADEAFVVPPSYSVNAIRKARALQYAVNLIHRGLVPATDYQGNWWLMGFRNEKAQVMWKGKL